MTKRILAVGWELATKRACYRRDCTIQTEGCVSIAGDDTDGVTGSVSCAATAQCDQQNKCVCLKIFSLRLFSGIGR